MEQTHGSIDREEQLERRDDLRNLFEDITGTVVIVEAQEEALRSRELGDGTSVSEYVAATTAADGLSDAISTPDGD